MISFYVIINNFNAGTFEPYDVMPYLIKEYNESKDKPSTIDEFKDFIEKKSRYQWKSRCEYEIILSDWPRQRNHEKWDIHRQVMMNINIITTVLMTNVLI